MTTVTLERHLDLRSTTAAVADPVVDPVDVWGIDSFPASDPPANW
jgi:hypothetical protein